MPEAFEEPEPPTTPTKKEFLAARLVQLWNALGEDERLEVLRDLEQRALKSQGAIEWN